MELDATALACWALAWAMGVAAVGLFAAGSLTLRRDRERDVKKRRRKTLRQPDPAYRPGLHPRRELRDYLTDVCWLKSPQDRPWYYLRGQRFTPPGARHVVVVCRCVQPGPIPVGEHPTQSPALQTVRLERVPLRMPRPGDRPSRWAYFYAGQCCRCEAILWCVAPLDPAPRNTRLPPPLPAQQQQPAPGPRVD